VNQTPHTARDHGDRRRKATEPDAFGSWHPRVSWLAGHSWTLAQASFRR